MFPQTSVTPTGAVALASEKMLEETDTEPADLDAFSEPSVAVEEIRTEAAPIGKAQTQKRVAEQQANPNPLLLDPYEFDRCTITIVYTRVGDQQVSLSVYNHKDEPIVKTFPLLEVPLPLPIACVIESLLEIWPDGKVSATLVLLPLEGGAERRLVASIRAGGDTPIVLSGAAVEFPLPPAIKTMLEELKELLPTRAMQQIEKAAKEKSKPIPQTVTTKPTSSAPTRPVTTTVNGKTQMTLF